MNTNALPKRKSWWPKLIIATYACFILFIGNMVRQAMSSDIDLVSKDYYQKEIAYQQHIDQVEATQSMGKQVLLNYAAAAQQFSVVFPAQTAQDSISGQLLFFRPSNASQDFTLPLDLNQDGQQHVATGKLEKGLWKVQLNWKQAGQDYYLQKNITVQ